MHFSIPDTQEFTDKTGSTYIGYHIYVNGSPHCVLRYRQLNTFHEQLKKAFGASSLPPFPPKKFLALSDRQLEERRSQLEKYIQLLSSQSGKVGSSEAFCRFFLSAQADSLRRIEPVCLQVFLTNSHSFRLDVKSNDSSIRVLEQSARILNLPAALLPYFSLFVIQWHDPQKSSCSSSTNSSLSSSGSSSTGNMRQQTSDFQLIRRLQAFESPFLTLNTLNSLTGKKHSLTLRKSYWDTSFDQELMCSDVGLNLLFQQTITDVSQGWISMSKEARHQLKIFQSDNCKKEYLELARTLKYYSYVHFENCVCDFPQIDCNVTVSLGGRELLIRPNDSTASAVKEYSFKVTRIRCWRLITSLESLIARPPEPLSKLQKLELSFEYLMNKDSLRWITIESDQAVLISLSLQGIVDELLMKRRGQKYSTSRTFSTPNTFPTTDAMTNNDQQADHRHMSTVSTGSSSTHCSSDSSIHSTNSGSFTGTDQQQHQQSIFSANGHMNGNPTNGIKYNVKKEVENDAFDGIGDDDL